MDQKDSYPEFSKNGKHFDFNTATTKYKTSLLFSIPKEAITTAIALFELIAISQKEKWYYTDILLVVTEVIETEKEIKIRLNTLSLQATFFEKELNQPFHLSRVYLDEKVDSESQEIKNAILEKIEVS